MSELFDIFFCYRRSGAQTAKLMKRHWIQRGWPGEVWYSDGESFGNFKKDITHLIPNAESVVVFLSEDFTSGFLNILDDGKGEDCITAHEIIEIIRKKAQDDSFRIITVNLDGYTLTQKDVDIIRKTLSFAGLCPEYVTFLTQCNRNNFYTAKDDEDVFFDKVAEHLLSDDFYKRHIRGSFALGMIPTSADLIAWDKGTGIQPCKIVFQIYDQEIGFYSALQKAKTATPGARQNDTMISVVRCDPFYEADKVLHVDVLYKTIDYRLFEKGIFLRSDPRLGINKQICEYTDRSKAFPIPNAVGMAIMVVTGDQKLVFSRRSAERRIRPLEYDCSIVEGLKLSDEVMIGGQPRYYTIDDPEYVEYEFHRAYLEELCPDDSDIRIHVSGLALDKEYAQWNLIGTIFTAKSQAELERMSAQRQDTYETRSLHFVPYVDKDGNRSLEEISRALALFRTQKMWSSALVALYSALIALGFSDKDISSISG